MSLCLGCFSNSAQTITGISAATSTQEKKANIKHLLLGSCNPTGGSSFYDTINPFFAGNTPADAAAAIHTALTATLYRNIVQVMPNLVTFDPVIADPTETEGTCGGSLYSSAGVTITATNLISDCVKPTGSGYADGYTQEQNVNYINANKEYKKLIAIDCDGYIWFWYSTQGETFDPSLNSSLMDFNPFITKNFQKVNGCTMFTGWKATLKNSCQHGEFIRAINLNELEADVQDNFRILGLF